MNTWFEVIAVAITLATLAVAVAAVIVIASGRAFRTAKDIQRQRRDARLRPLLFDIIDGKPTDLSVTRDRTHLIEIAVRAAHNVRGADRAVLGEWLRRAGAQSAALKMLRSRRALQRARGVELLLPVADGQIRHLEQLLVDRDRAVRALACEALGRAAALEAIPALLRATGNGHRQVPPSLTAMAIIRMTPRTADVLLANAAALSTPVHALVVELTGTLNLLDARAPLEELLLHSDTNVRISAIRSLGQLGLPRSADALERHAPSSAAERAALATARAAILA